MPNRYAWWALGVGAYLAFAISLLPAATAYRLFAPDTLRLAGVDGTVWSGSAALGSVAGLPFSDVRWDIEPLALFTGRLSGRIEARLADGFAEADVGLTTSRTVLRDLRANTSIAALSELLPLDGTEGRLSVSLDELRLVDGWPTAVTGEARIAQLAVPPLFRSGADPSPIPLGDYEIVFTDTAGRGIAAQFQDTGGPLEVSGTLALDPSRNYRIEGVAAPRGGAPAELVQGLEIMSGQPNAEGKRPFTLTGSL